MILKSITVKNYKSIIDSTAKFENGLNVIIGKNGAGKSNLLQFINRNMTYHGIIQRNRNRVSSNSDFSFTIQYKKDKKNFSLSISLTSDKLIKKGEVQHNRIIELTKKSGRETIINNKKIFTPIKSKENDQILMKELEPLRRNYSQYITFETPNRIPWISFPTKHSINSEYETESENYLEGITLSDRLDITFDDAFYKFLGSDINSVSEESIKNTYFEEFESYIEKIQLTHYLSTYSQIQDIRLNPNINVYKIDGKIIVENLLIDFKIGKTWFPWSYLSDGTKRMLYIISECVCNTGLLLIEEPELGIHPHQLNLLLNFIKEQAEHRQVIISTHSPLALDILAPEELSKINIAKLSDKGTQFHKLDKNEIIAAQAYMKMIGNLSYYWLHSDLEK